MLKHASPAGLLSGPATLESRLGKAKPSTVASSIPESSLINPRKMESIQEQGGK
jgi:hypothetical protein